ncbi:YegP family protein [Phocoenobacter skyensis]|uniref:YegP family protein n=1 Tax=Phocoenobacter skyensis TaxID=97481 RepID=A0A1H7ZRC1_9PAST|nr:YegP family protein [Pasteurella skyensis]MDP8080332.1 YegP family protein [Pasteurella skyensis]MDP8086318.1 YegP family protein [Pasteurella skyensis]MDP8162081.1 YegP family protein [Pasteurella skyensis]MDP8172237.1 YegP family protein [Pasteurella skyensis]MDP8174787.1 YegP family protein [Pasteurella skyensis]
MALGWYELKLAKDGQFMFNLKAANSQVILTSELYKSRASAENGIASVQKNGSNESLFEIRVAKNDKPYFILKAKNHQEIGRSQYYSSQAATKNGIKSVMNNSVSTVIKDLTAE